jgi:hypothetical protein
LRHFAKRANLDMAVSRQARKKFRRRYDAGSAKARERKSPQDMDSMPGKVNSPHQARPAE